MHQPLFPATVFAASVPSALIVYLFAVVLGVVLYWLRARLGHFWLGILGACTGAVVCLATWELVTAFWPWWMAHLFDEGAPVIRMLFGEPVLLFTEGLAYVAAFATLALLQNRLANKKALEAIFLVVITIVLFVNTLTIAHLSRDHASDEARKQITNTKTLVSALLKDAGRVTSDCIIRDQAIAKIVNQIYVLVWNDFPEIRLKAVSLHVMPQKNHSDKAWNVIQVGRETKDLELLDLHKPNTPDQPGSLAAAAILIRPSRRRYCPDVNGDRNLADCKYYQRSPTGPQVVYSSIVCFPVVPTIGGGDIFASICLDGENHRPWDDRLDELGEDVTAQARNLYDLLQDFRQDDGCLFQR